MMHRDSFGSNYGTRFGQYAGLGFLPYTAMMDRQVGDGLAEITAEGLSDEMRMSNYSGQIYKAWYQGAAVGAGVVAVAWIGAIIWYMRKKKR